MLKVLGKLKIPTRKIEVVQQTLTVFDNEKLVSLDLSNFKLDEIPDDTFADIPDVQILFLKGNRISKLSEKIFKPMNDLVQLDLSHNNLDFLGSKTFSNLSNLRYLILSFNKLKNLPEFLFSNLNKVEKLDLSSNHLTKLPNGIFSNLRNLKNLTLACNDLSSLPTSLFQLQKLEKLILVDNPLSGGINRFYRNKAQIHKLFSKLE